MNEALQLALLKEHARDKRLTFINYLWIWIVAIAVIYLAYHFLGSVFFENLLKEMNHPYLKFVVPGVLLLYMSYGIANIVKIGRRKQMIEELGVKLSHGSKATNIVESKVYKITIPLGKLNIRLCPVDYFMFCLDCNPARYYNLPVPYAYMPDFKNVLSGASLDTLYDHLNDIYSEKEIVYDPADDVPVKSVAEFREYLTSELQDDVKSLEEKRKSAGKMSNIGQIIMVVMTVGMVGFSAWHIKSGAEIDPFLFMKFGIGIAVVYYIFYFLVIHPKALRREGNMVPGALQTTGFQFKNNIMNKMVKFISPKAECIMHGHIGYEELLASGMFREDRYDITGNDLIIGRHRGVPFQFCDLTIQVTSRISQENEAPDTAFYGQFFVARFNKSFSTPVYLTPRKGLAGKMRNNDISTYTFHQGEKIQLEDPEFMQMFNVYAVDQIEARYLLTPSLMERIKELAKRTKGDYHITFYENKITVANNSGKNNFEIKENKSIVKDDYKVLTDFYSEMCDQFALIDDLKLNVKIWK